MDRLPVLALSALLPALGGCSPASGPEVQRESLTAGTTLLDYHGPSDAFGHPVAPAGAMGACGSTGRSSRLSPVSASFIASPWSMT